MKEDRPLVKYAALSGSWFEPCRVSAAGSPPLLGYAYASWSAAVWQPDIGLKGFKCCVSTEQGNSSWKLPFFFCHFINENKDFVGKAFNRKLSEDICVVPAST